MPGSAVSPRRGEVWGVDLNPTKGREQAVIRPALIVSDDALNSGPRDLVIVCPITGTNRGIQTHIPVAPPEGGLTKPSVIMIEQLRSVTLARFGHRLGMVSPETMKMVDQVLGIVLSL